MVARITQSAIQAGALQQLQRRMSSQATLQEQITSGKRINRPSDDPSGSVDIMRMRTQQRADTQYARNANNAVAWLTTIDNSLTQVSTQLTKARTLTLQGANAGALSNDQRQAIANDIDAIGQSLLSLANTNYNGRLVFAGTSSADAAFTAQTDPATGAKTYTYNGFSGSGVERRVADATTVRIDSDGSEVFGTGGSSVFAMIDTIAQKLRDGEDISSYVGDIDAAASKVMQEVGRIGSRENQAVDAQNALQDRKVTLRSQLSSVEDLDMPAALVELSTLEVSYQVALASTAKVLQPSLLDHLR